MGRDAGQNAPLREPDTAWKGGGRTEASRTGAFAGAGAGGGERHPTLMGKNAELKNGTETAREPPDENSQLSKDRGDSGLVSQGPGCEQGGRWGGGKRGCLRSQRRRETSGCGKVSESSLGRQSSGEFYA